MAVISIPFLAFIALLAVLVVYVIGAAKRQSDARRNDLSALASHFGLQFIPGTLNDRLPGGVMGQIFGDRSLTESGQFIARFAALWPFGQGEFQRAYNLIYGSYGGQDWTLFDYGYQTTSQSAPINGIPQTSTVIHSFGVICARVPCDLPSIHLSPENFLHRVGCKLGVHEMTFESEEFNHRYFIRSNDERAAYDILHPQAIDYLLTLPVRDWQICGCQIVIARSGHYSIEEIPRVMGEIDGFIRLIPGYVREDRGFVPDWKGPFK
jgi:hypothetical protein